jgi:hypothetical protein
MVGFDIFDEVVEVAELTLEIVNQDIHIYVLKGGLKGFSGLQVFG